MAKRLTDETLRMDIVLNGNEAQKQLGDLQQAQRNLRKENEEIRKQKAKMIAQGKKETEAYKNLAKQLTENNKAIKANSKEQTALRKEMGLAALTTRQLAQEEKRLKAIMGSFSPNTPQWNKYNKELQEVVARKKEVNAQMRSTSKAMGDSANNWLTTAFGVGVFLEAGREALQFAKQWISDARQMADEAKGVEFAYEALGERGQDAFNRIKQASRGLISDLNIKQATVELDAYGISLSEADKLMEFAAVRAAQTGKSFEYMMSSLVEGLSKESKLRIDNLGISAAALNDELEETPDFVQAVANIAKREIADAGSILDDAASSSAQWDATLQNLQLRFGKLFNSTGFIQNLQRAGSEFFKLITPAESVTESLESQTKKVIDLNKNLSPLIDEYDDLSQKSELSADEQDRLSDIIQEIARITPGAITAFDEYGNALDISSEKARAFLRTQQAMLQYRNQDAIKEQTEQLEQYRKVAERIQRDLNTRDSNGNVTVTTSSSVGTGGVSTATRKATDEEIAQMQDRLAKYQQMVAGAEASIEELSGDYLNKYLERQKQQTAAALQEARKRADALGVEYSEEATTAQIEALIKQWESKSDERKKLAEEYAKQAEADERARLKAIDDLEKQYLQEKQNREAVSFTAQAELEKRRALEKAEALRAENDLLDQIKAEHDIKIAEARAKDEEVELQRIQDFEKRKRELENEIALSKAASEQEKELLKQEQDNEKAQLQLEQELERLQLNEAQKTELLKLLTEQQNAAIAEIENKWREKKIKDEEAVVKKRKALFQESVDAAIQAAGAETKVGQALLIVKQLFALKEQAIALGLFTAKANLNAAEATTDIAKGTAKTASSVPFPANIPLIIGFAATVAGLVKTIKSATKKGQQAGRVRGYEEGLYPLTRTDGKKFNVKYGGRTRTGIVNQPTHFSDDYMAGERGPELVVDNATFRRLDPTVVRHILNVRSGVRGYETGKYPQQTPTSQLPVTEQQQAMQLNIEKNNALLSMLMERFSQPIQAVAAIGYRDQQKLQDMDADRKRSAQNGTLAE